MRRALAAPLGLTFFAACTGPPVDVSVDGPGVDAGVEVDAPPDPAPGARYVWARMLSGPSDEDEVDAVASDAAGNVYISGKFEESLTIEGHPDVLVSRGRADIMVASYTPDGTLRWVRHVGGAGEDNIFDAAVTPEGDLVLSGYFAGRLVLGDTVLESSSIDDLDMLVVKLDSNGNLRWAIRAGGPGSDGGNEVNVAPDGTIVALAGTSGAFAVEPGVQVAATSGPQQAVVVTLDGATGAARWAAAVGGTGGARAKCLAVAPDGSIFAGGDYAGDVADRASGTTAEFPRSRSLDAYIVAYSAQGARRWFKTWGGTDLDLCKGAEASEPGTLYLVGYASDGARFDAEAPPITGRDLFVWKLDTNGTSRWLAHVASDTDLTGAEVTSAPAGGIVFGHAMDARVVYGAAAGAPLTVELPVAGTQWPSFVRYTADGEVAEQLFPAQSGMAANMDEVSRSGIRVYIDVPIFAGTFQFGSDVRQGNGTKDALLVAIDL